MPENVEPDHIVIEPPPVSRWQVADVLTPPEGVSPVSWVYALSGCLIAPEQYEPLCEMVREIRARKARQAVAAMYRDIGGSD